LNELHEDRFRYIDLLYDIEKEDPAFSLEKNFQTPEKTFQVHQISGKFFPIEALFKLQHHVVLFGLCSVPTNQLETF